MTLHQSLNSPSNSYDEIPYPAGAHPQTHPDHLAMIGTLFGMEPPSVESCRVLELGCADGGNLIPMASNLPHAEFVGIDLSPRQVADGCALVAHLGLTNIRISHRNITDIDGSLGQFDYILAHGVFSWVPHEVQECIFELCQRLLTPQGLAYISYNTYPGWRMRGMLRDMMLYHTRRFSDPHQQVQQARALIQFLAKEGPNSSDPYGLLLQQELDEMRHWDDSYLRHDSLEEVNDPIYFYEFVERAAEHGLRYLAESEFQTMLTEHLSATASSTLGTVAMNQVDLEQYMDFVGNRMFRQTLLCHASVKPTRDVSSDRIKHLHFAANVKSTDATPEVSDQSVVEFCDTAGNTITVRRPVLKAALIVLRECWPASLSYNELLNQAHLRLGTDAALTDRDQNSLASMLLKSFAARLIQIYSTPRCLTATVSDRPLAGRLARWQANSNLVVTNQLHQNVELDEASRRLLARLDGSRKPTDLADTLSQRPPNGVHHDSQVLREVECRLVEFAQQALLVE